MAEIKEEIMTIHAAKLGVGRGHITWLLLLEDETGSVIGVGGHCLDNSIDSKVKGINSIRHLLEIAGVDWWSDLPGKKIRTRGRYFEIKEVGHLTQEKWIKFSPRDMELVGWEDWVNET